MGVRVDVMDTGNAVVQFDILATERGDVIAGGLKGDFFGWGGKGCGRDVK